MATFVVIDAGGCHVDTARTIGKEGHKVFYFNTWQSMYPRFEAYAPGVGIPEIESVMDWAPYVDEADCIIIPDIGMGGLAQWLRDSGYPVFGGGVAEIVENDRIISCDIMDKYNIKYPTTLKIHGVDEAIQSLEKLLSGKSETAQLSDGEYFVKFNTWRGSLETFPVESIDQAKFMLDSAKSSLGPYANEVPMVISKKVSGIEMGWDGIMGKTGLLKPIMMGFESGENYVGRMVDDLGPMQPMADQIEKYLKDTNYIGFVSVEVIYDGKDCHMLDFTIRSPMPLGLMYSKFIPNFGDFLISVANGETPTLPMPKDTYLGCVKISSDEANEKYLKISGNENTRFLRYMMVKDECYSVPGLPTVGVITGQGKSFKELEDNFEKNSNGVSVFFGNFDTGFLENVKKKYIEPLEKLGISFGPNTETECRFKTDASNILDLLTEKNHDDAVYTLIHADGSTDVFSDVSQFLKVAAKYGYKRKGTVTDVNSKFYGFPIMNGLVGPEYNGPGKAKYTAIPKNKYVKI